jgi:hypothetical protein
MHLVHQQVIDGPGRGRVATLTEKARRTAARQRDQRRRSAHLLNRQLDRATRYASVHTAGQILASMKRHVSSFLDARPRRDLNDVGRYWYLAILLEEAGLDVDDVRLFPFARLFDSPRPRQVTMGLRAFHAAQDRNVRLYSPLTYRQ